MVPERPAKRPTAEFAEVSRPVDDCPECSGTVVAGQGVFACPDCGWAGLVA